MARQIGRVKVHRYTIEFKLRAVKLGSLKGVQVQDVAEALDIHAIMLDAAAQGSPGGSAAWPGWDNAGGTGAREMTEFSKHKRENAFLKYRLVVNERGEVRSCPFTVQEKRTTTVEVR